MNGSKTLGGSLIVLGVVVFAAWILVLPPATQGGPAGVFTLLGVAGATMLSLVTVGVGVRAVRRSTATGALMLLFVWIVGAVAFGVAFFDLFLFLSPASFAILCLLAFVVALLAGKRVGARIDDG